MIVASRIFLAYLLCALAFSGETLAAGEKPLRVAVIDNSPHMTYRDARGELTGFNIEIMKALCEEINAACEFHVTTLDYVVSALASNEYDVAAVGLLDTPERRATILLSRPYFRSVTLWFARPGVVPGQNGFRVAVVRGSAQERYALLRSWEVVRVRTNGELAEPIRAGLAQAAIIPMSSAFNLMKSPDFLDLGLTSSVMHEPELCGDASFGISPARPEIKEQIDAALERIKRNGTYDRVNSQFMPFRVN